MAPAMKGAISFGLLHVPVSLHPASQDSGLHFHQLCRRDGARIQYKKVCPQCGKEVQAGDIVKGYELEKGRYVILEEADLEKAKPKRDRTLRILHFADLSSIRVQQYQKPYHVLPEAGGDRALELLRRCMWEEHLVAVAQGILGQSEHMFALIPTESGILAEMLYFQEELRSVPREPARPDLTEQELTMGKTILRSMQEEFHPEAHRDEYRDRILALIQAKAANREYAPAPEAEEGNILNMMDALQQMLQQAQGGAGTGGETGAGAGAGTGAGGRAVRKPRAGKRAAGKKATA